MVISFDEALAALQRLNQERPRVLPTEVVPSSVAPPSSSVPPSSEGALRSIYSRFGTIASALQSIESVVSPDRRVYLTQNADDPFGGDLQRAIDSCESPTAAAPWIVQIVTPGVYEGNFVVPEHVYLVAVNPGTTPGVTLQSSSGNTLTFPDTNSGASGLTVFTTSPLPADAAINVVPGSGSGDATRFVLMRANGIGGGASLRTQPGTGGVGPIVGIYLDANGTSDVLLDLLGAGIVINLGGVTNFGPNGTAIRATNGSFTLLFQAVLQTANGGTGWLVDADAGSTVYVFNASTVNTANGYRGRTGAFLGVFNHDFLLNLSGTLLDLDALSFAGLGQIQIAMGANPYDLIVAAAPGNVVFAQSLQFLEGLLAGRPATPAPGMRYYATDRPAGTRQLTFTSLGWVDQADTVVP